AGLAPTVMVALGAVGIDEGFGVTAKFTAEVEGRFAAIPGFCTTMGYRPGVVAPFAGVGTINWRLLVTVGATATPLNVAVVPPEEVWGGKKKPPERVMFALEAIEETLAGVEAITAGRTGATVKLAGGDVSPFVLRT